jgi:hypothetical protein
VNIAPAPTPPLTSGSLEFSQDSYSITRGDSALVVTVNRVGGSGGAVMATYTTQDGSALSGQEYSSTSGMLYWPDGDSSPKTFVVPVSSQATAGHSFSLSLVSSAGAPLDGIVTANADIVLGATITASWSAPTTHVDGTPLTDLAGYYICISGFGFQPNRTIPVADPSATSITISDIPPGTYYLTAMAYDSTGAISLPASTVSTVIQ